MEKTEFPVKKVRLYSFKEDELVNEIPKAHSYVIDPETQKKASKAYFEKHVGLWDAYYSKSEGNPYKHNLPLLISILKRHQSKKTLLDVGCGAGIPLIEFLKLGFAAEGCDFADRGVALSKENLKKLNHDIKIVFKADIEDRATLPRIKYDVITSIGVFPHITNEAAALRNIHDMLSDDGVALIQFRNDLFSLFTLNAYSKDLYKRLVGFDTLPEPLRSELDSFYNEKLSAAAINSEFEILSKHHNPLTITKTFEDAGFEVKGIHFFHYHRLPPIFQVTAPETFVKLSEQMENPNDWHGYFMASSFVVEATKKYPS